MRRPVPELLSDDVLCLLVDVIVVGDGGVVVSVEPQGAQTAHSNINKQLNLE